MSRGPQRKLAIPSHWWTKLAEECRSRGIPNVEALCKNRPLISARTIKDAFRSGEMTEAKFGDLATLLGHKHIYDLIKAWGSAAGPNSGPDQQLSRSTREVGGSPALHMSFPFFRDIQLKRWQEIPLEERPHPFPLVTNNPSPPFSSKPSEEVDYVAGWNIRLRAGARYRLTYTLGKNDAWSEIEIILYQRVPRMNYGGELWRRAVSAGAVTSGELPSDVTPQSEEWLITCWGKTVIASDAPWWALIPNTYDLDNKNAALTLSFTDQRVQDGQGGLSAAPATAASNSALHMQAVA